MDDIFILYLHHFLFINCEPNSILPANKNNTKLGINNQKLILFNLDLNPKGYYRKIYPIRG